MEFMRWQNSSAEKNSMHIADWRALLFPGDNYKQELRIKRLLLAVAVYVFCLFVVYLSYFVDLMRWEGFAGLAVVIPIINIFLYIVFRSGLNLKMADPSLTSVQMYIGSLVTMYGMYFTTESRGVLLLFYVVVLLFGSFHLDTRGFLHVSIFILMGYFVDILLLINYRPQSITINTELVQWIMLAFILIIFSIIGGADQCSSPKTTRQQNQTGKIHQGNQGTGNS